MLGHVLDQSQTALGFKVDGDRPFVGVVDHEIIRIGHTPAPRLPAIGILHLDDIRTHPGQRLGAGCSGLELGQIENLDAGETIRRYGRSIHLFTPSETLRSVQAFLLHDPLH